MYNLSVLAMFKNESMIIKDWIEHYIKEGVNHFYLIDNGSTDNYLDKIKDRNSYITLTVDGSRLPQDTQAHLYNKIYLDKIKKETKWLIICDIDEYIYARNGNKKILDVLNKLPEHVEKIWLPWKFYGSNGHVAHPENIIKSFTKRQKKVEKNKGFGKCICRTNNLVRINTCGHVLQLSKNDIYYNSNGDNLDNYEFTDENVNKLNLHLNHYMLLSEEYYKNIKCVRGGGESGVTGKYTMNFFKSSNSRNNEITDDELFKKNYN